MSQKVVDPYKHMDDWEKLNEASPVKEDFYSNHVYITILYLPKHWTYY